VSKALETDAAACVGRGVLVETLSVFSHCFGADAFCFYAFLQETSVVDTLPAREDFLSIHKDVKGVRDIVIS
jgi:hypothetical protein